MDDIPKPDSKSFVEQFKEQAKIDDLPKASLMGIAGILASLIVGILYETLKKQFKL